MVEDGPGPTAASYLQKYGGGLTADAYLKKYAPRPKLTVEQQAEQQRRLIQHRPPTDEYGQAVGEAGYDIAAGLVNFPIQVIKKATGAFAPRPRALPSNAFEAQVDPRAALEHARRASLATRPEEPTAGEMALSLPLMGYNLESAVREAGARMEEGTGSGPEFVRAAVNLGGNAALLAAGRVTEAARGPIVASADRAMASDIMARVRAGQMPTAPRPAPAAPPAPPSEAVPTAPTAAAPAAPVEAPAAPQTATPPAPAEAAPSQIAVDRAYLRRQGFTPEQIADLEQKAAARVAAGETPQARRTFTEHDFRNEPPAPGPVPEPVAAPEVAPAAPVAGAAERVTETAPPAPAEPQPTPPQGAMKLATGKSGIVADAQGNRFRIVDNADPSLVRVEPVEGGAVRPMGRAAVVDIGLPPEVNRETGVLEAPNVPRGAPIPEGARPGAALHDAQGRVIPGTEVPEPAAKGPGSPGFVERRAETPPDQEIVFDRRRTYIHDGEGKVVGRGPTPLEPGDEFLAAAEATKPTPTDIAGAVTGKPVRATLFRGSGRAEPGSVYSEYVPQEPVLGAGRYSTPSKEFAQTFGPQMEQVTADLKNPLVITNDAQWRTLTKRAGWPFPNPFGGDVAAASQAIARLRSMVEGDGYDGVVIRLPEPFKQGLDDSAKTLADVFGEDQVVEFKPPAAPPDAFDVAAGAPHNEAAAQATLFGGEEISGKAQTELLPEAAGAARAEFPAGPAVEPPGAKPAELPLEPAAPLTRPADVTLGQWRRLKAMDPEALRAEYAQRVQSRDVSTEQSVTRAGARRDQPISGRFAGIQAVQQNQVLAQMESVGRARGIDLAGEFQQGLEAQRHADASTTAWDEAAGRASPADFAANEREVRSFFQSQGLGEVGGAHREIAVALTRAGIGAAAGAWYGATQTDNPKDKGINSLIGAALGATALFALPVLLKAERARPNSLVDAGYKLLAPAAREGANVGAAGVREAKAWEAREGDIARASLARGRQVMASLPEPERWAAVAESESPGGVVTHPALKGPLGAFRKAADAARTEAQRYGRLNDYIENWFPHMWEGSEGAKQVLTDAIMGRRPLAGRAGFLKQRVLRGTITEAMQIIKDNNLDLRPKFENPMDMALAGLSEMKRWLAAQHIREFLEQRNLLQLHEYGRRGPEGYARINDALFRAGSKGEYWAPEPVARILNNHLSPGLRGNALYDAYMGLGNTLNRVQLGLSFFHAGFVTVDAITSRVAAGIQNLASGHPLKGLGKIVTGPTAPLAYLREGVKIGREWKVPGSQDPHFAGLVDQIVKAGGRAETDAFYRGRDIAKFMDGLRRHDPVTMLARAPLAVIQSVSSLILEKYVPAMKRGAFAELADAEMGRLGRDATEADVRAALMRAWDSVDNRLGQVVYDNVFWNRAFKDVLHATQRSVGWNWGTMRELGGGGLDILAGKGMTPRAAYVMALPITVGLLGSVTNVLLTGELPRDLRDLYMPRTGRRDADGNEERVNFPSYMKDVFAYARHPLTTVTHKTNPALSLIIEMLQNRDYYGDMIRNPDAAPVQQLGELADYLGQAALPFAVTQSMESSKRQQPLGIRLAPFVGVTPAPRWAVRTKAQNLMSEMQQQTGGEARTPEQAKASQQRGQLLSRMRTGQAGPADLQALALQGSLSYGQGRSMLARARVHPLVDRFQRLRSLEDMERVYAAGTPQEQKMWWPTLMRRQQAAAAARSRITSGALLGVP